MQPDLIGRFLVTAFFAVVFLQSALDKLTDSAGNLEFLAGHFKNSPFPPEMVTRMFWILTALEATAGVLCGLGLVFLISFASLSRPSRSISRWRRRRRRVTKWSALRRP